MSEIKDIQIIENKECVLSFESQILGQENIAYIEWITKNDEVLKGEINSEKFKYEIQEDGLHKYYIVVCHILDWFLDSITELYTIPINAVFFYDNAFYLVTKNCIDSTLETVLENSEVLNDTTVIWEKAQETEYCDYGSVEHYCLCLFSKCYIARQLEFLNNFLDNGCFGSCKENQEVDIKSFLTLISKYILEYLRCLKDYDEVDRLLGILNSCDQFLCPKDVITKAISGGCNCGKHG